MSKTTFTEKLGKKLFSGDSAEGETVRDYKRVTDDMVGGDGLSDADTNVHFAEIKNGQDLERIKDRLYDGDMVIAGIKYIESNNINLERVHQDLNVVVEEINGDIVQRGNEHIVVVPEGMNISREKI